MIKAYLKTTDGEETKFETTDMENLQLWLELVLNKFYAVKEIRIVRG